MKSSFTDKKIRHLLWEAKELPSYNKATYLLGDLSSYGVSRCIKNSYAFHSVWYLFDVYSNGEFRSSLVVELPSDFTIKDIERSILRLWEKGGMIASNDTETQMKWLNDIKPIYSYDHAKYSAIKFLEALRRKFILKK